MLLGDDIGSEVDAADVDAANDESHDDALNVASNADAFIDNACNVDLNVASNVDLNVASNVDASNVGVLNVEALNAIAFHVG